MEPARDVHPSQRGVNWHVDLSGLYRRVRALIGQGLTLRAILRPVGRPSTWRGEVWVKAWISCWH
eukprot:3531513-Pyramimonas_sp.AAC.1